MKREAPRAYVDTSVFGGIVDDEFKVVSHRFFDAIGHGAFKLVVSDVVRRELVESPIAVRQLFDQMLSDADVATVTADALRLRQAYIAAGIVTRRWMDDALHVALASVHHCAMIVSWNFKHIVHFEKIPRYNAVNALNGYSTIFIYSPLELVGYADRNKDL